MSGSQRDNASGDWSGGADRGADRRRARLTRGNPFTAWAVSALGIWVFMGLLTVDSLVPDLRQWKARAEGSPVAVELARSHLRLVEITRALVVVSVPAAVCFLLWQLKAHAHARAARPGEVRIGPIPALLAWVIPVANVLAPLAAMSELWRASDPDLGPGEWRAKWVNPVVLLWWLLWLGGLALLAWGLYQNHHLGGIVLEFGRPGGNSARFLTRDRTLIGAAAVGVVDALLAIALIVWINDRQLQQVGRISFPLWANRRPG